ncbi:MAG TPA: ABC transporter substrate-binding protein [Candidatus Binatia bacterium]|nr:ABC transporter substrate-binding protein [Candidatus Binatia bacterium]
MKGVMSTVRGIIALALSLFAFPAHAGEPLELVKTTAERAIEIFKDPEFQPREKKKERIERLKETVNPIFDYEDMAKRALGPHWRRRTPAEQQEFVKLFRGFLEKIYSDKILFYSGEKVLFGRESIDNGFAQVESSVVNSKGEEIHIVYKLRRSQEKWKVYDAVVENISIVNNYRSQFDRVIGKSSYEELVKMLQEKIK